MIVQYKLTADGGQPYQVLEGFKFEGGQAIIDGWYIGTLMGEKLDVALELCKDYQMSEASLDIRKILLVNKVSDLSFSERETELPEYKLVNAALGVYSEAEKTAILDKVKAYRNEYYRVKELAENALDLKELDSIVITFPSNKTARPDQL